MPECAEDDTFALQQVPFLKVANDRVLLLTMSESSLMECQNSVALTGRSDAHGLEVGVVESSMENSFLP